MPPPISVYALKSLAIPVPHARFTVQLRAKEGPLWLDDWRRGVPHYW
jgi:hypothetical protein